MENKQEGEHNNMDTMARLLVSLPRIFLRGAVDIITFLDYFGMLPRFITDLSPFHGSMFITNMGSLGMPPIFPTGIAMAFELAAYGLISGILYKKLPKKGVYVYVALISAMLLGRLVWGTVMAIISGFGGAEFGFDIFIANGFVNALPGIICHILIIPVIVLALKKAKLTVND